MEHAAWSSLAGHLISTTNRPQLDHACALHATRITAWQHHCLAACRAQLLIASYCVLQVPLCKVNLQGLEALVKQYKGRYSTVVGFQPTGWTHAKESTSAKCGKRMQRGTVILHQVGTAAQGTVGPLSPSICACSMDPFTQYGSIPAAYLTAAYSQRPQIPANVGLIIPVLKEAHDFFLL
jgi:hypothetical protein